MAKCRRKAEKKNHSVKRSKFESGIAFEQKQNWFLSAAFREKFEIKIAICPKGLKIILK